MYVIIIQCITDFIKIYYVTVSVVTVIFQGHLLLCATALTLYNYLIINYIYNKREKAVKVWVSYFFTVIL